MATGGSRPGQQNDAAVALVAACRRWPLIVVRRGCRPAAGSAGSLKPNLLAASGGGGDSAQCRKYDAAVAEQRDQLQRGAQAGARRRLRLFAVRPAMASAAGQRARSTRWSATSSAAAQARRSLPAADRRQSRAKLMAALDANGCRDEAAVRQPPSDGTLPSRRRDRTATHRRLDCSTVAIRRIDEQRQTGTPARSSGTTF